MSAVCIINYNHNRGAQFDRLTQHKLAKMFNKSDFTRPPSNIHCRDIGLHLL